jgi:transposase, IS5 family
VLALTEQTGELLQRSVTEARRLAAVARRKARRRGAKAKLKAAAALEHLTDRCEKVARQIKQRVAGEPIKDRIISLADPDARSLRKGKLGKPNLGRYRGYADIERRLVVNAQRPRRFARSALPGLSA